MNKPKAMKPYTLNKLKRLKKERAVKKVDPNEVCPDQLAEQRAQWAAFVQSVYEGCSDE